MNAMSCRPSAEAPLWNRRQFLRTSGAMLAVPLIGAAPRGDNAVSAFVAAYNSNDRHVLARWIERHVSQGGLARRSAADWSEWLAGQFARTGRLRPLAVEARDGGQRLLCTLEKFRGERRIDLRLDRDDSARLFDLRPVAEATPYPARPNPAERVGDGLERIRKRVAFAVARGEFSGVVRIDRGGSEPLFLASHGLAAQAQPRPVDAGTRFNLGSADKSFTAILIAQMVEGGQLALDSTVGDLLPDFAIPTARGITIRHLLTHQAGLSEPRGGIRAYSHDRYDRVTDLLPAIAAVPPAFAPGARTSYSNEGYVVLGAIIERMAQQPFWHVLSSRIYERAGMRSSGHFTRDEASNLCATGYYQGRDDLFGCLPARSNAAELPWRGNSCGGGYSTAADITAYLGALGAGRLVSPASFDMLTRETGEIYPGVKYAMGFVREQVGETAFVGHSGGGQFSGVGSSLRMALAGGWSVAILGNCDVSYSDAILHDILPMLDAIPA